jgi:prophage regulatory protein
MATKKQPVSPRLSILRRPDVESRTGLARSTIYLRVSQGTFPRPVSLGGRAVGWIESEIEDWLRRQVDASRGQEATSSPADRGG